MGERFREAMSCFYRTIQQHHDQVPIDGAEKRTIENNHNFLFPKL